MKSETSSYHIHYVMLCYVSVQWYTGLTFALFYSIGTWPSLSDYKSQTFGCKGNWTFRPFVSSPPGLFAPYTYSTIPAYSVKTKYHSFDIFNYSHHSVHMSCWIKKVLTYLLTDQGRPRRHQISPTYWVKYPRSRSRRLTRHAAVEFFPRRRRRI